MKSPFVEGHRRGLGCPRGCPRPLAAVTSPVVAVKTWPTLILDLDVSLVIERALDSLDDVGGGTPTAVVVFARASSPLVKSLVAAVAVECPERHAALFCRRRVQVKQKMRKRVLRT
ncbi:hypothetical protein Dimus_024084 [Dionaea muscipula]